MSIFSKLAGTVPAGTTETAVADPPVPVRPAGPTVEEIEQLIVAARDELATLAERRDELALASLEDLAASEPLADLDAETAKVSARLETLTNALAAARRRHADYEAQVRLSQRFHAMTTLDRNLAARLRHAAKLEALIGDVAKEWRRLIACGDRAATAFPGLPPQGGALDTGGLSRLVAAELHRVACGPHGDLGIRHDLSFPGAQTDNHEWRDRPSAMPSLTERVREANHHALEEHRKLVMSGAFDGCATEAEPEPTDEGSN